MNKLTQLFLERRGYTDEMLKKIMDPSHPDLMNVDAICEALKKIHDSQQHIVVLPDFDMDGITSGVIGYAGLSELGFTASLYRPTPADGYGFTASTVKELIQEFPTVKAIITCDVGITCYEGIDYANSQGVQVLVTDHHVQESKERLHASVVVDPNCIDDTYPNKGICGAHVFWQVLQHYAEKYASPFIQSQIYRLRVFAGMGTISDAMPLVNENRPLVRDSAAICRLLFGEQGLNFLNSLSGCKVYRRAFWGLHYTLEEFAENGKIQKPEDIDEDFFGFYLAPTFNALKRMNGNMDIGFGAFFSNNPKDCASELFAMNEQRKSAVATYFHEMMTTDQPYAPYVYISEAQPGILGLLAMKAMTLSGVPTMVLRQDDDSYHGSGRAPVWYQAITELHPQGFYIAGHQGAFGIGVKGLDQLKALHDVLESRVAEIITEMEEQGIKPDCSVEADIVIAQNGAGDTAIDIPLLRGYWIDMQRLKPFGRGFEAPKIELRFDFDQAKFVTIGSVKQHLKAQLAYGFEALCWNQSNIVEDLKPGDKLIIDGHLSVSEYMDTTTLCMIGDIRKEER